MIRVEIQVDNSGPAPAKDVLVNMHFPNGLKPLASQDLREVIKRMPRAPQDPTDFSWLRQGFGPGIDPSVYSIAPRNPDAPSLFIEETNSFNVRWHVPKLRQGYASTIDPITVLFATTPFSFPITYTIVADNSHDIVEGTLNVVLT